MPRVSGVDSFRTELIRAGRSRFGKPFLHHFRPDRCQNGTVTLPDCWERGLDDDGYDCSGFVIASICDVLGMQLEKWPQDRRHIRQMLCTGDSNAIPVPGDVIFTMDPEAPSRQHMGIYSGNGRMLHADGRTSSPYINESPIDTGSHILVMKQQFRAVS